MGVKTKHTGGMRSGQTGGMRSGKTGGMRNGQTGGMINGQTGNEPSAFLRMSHGQTMKVSHEDNYENVWL